MEKWRDATEALDRIEALAPRDLWNPSGATETPGTSVPSLDYCALRALAGSRGGKTLRYGQALDPDRMGAVTFAGVVFTDAADGGARAARARRTFR
jgi:hypothetical protein